MPTKLKSYQIDLNDLVSALQINTGSGSNILPTILQNFADLSEVASGDEIPYLTSANTFGLVPFDSFGRSFAGTDSAEEARYLLGIPFTDDPVNSWAAGGVPYWDGAEFNRIAPSTLGLNLFTGTPGDFGFLFHYDDGQPVWLSAENALGELGIPFSPIPGFFGWGNGTIPIWNSSSFNFEQLDTTSFTRDFIVNVNSNTEALDWFGIPFEEGAPYEAGYTENMIPVWKDDNFFSMMPERYYGMKDRANSWSGLQQFTQGISLHSTNNPTISSPSAQLVDITWSNGEFLRIYGAGGVPTQLSVFNNAMNIGSATSYTIVGGATYLQLNSAIGTVQTIQSDGVIDFYQNRLNVTSSGNYQSGQKIVDRLTAINNVYWVTGHSGGGTDRLDGLTTADGTWPVNSIVIINPTGALPTAYRLVNGTSGTHTSYSTVRPVDYNASTNAKYWNSISLG